MNQINQIIQDVFIKLCMCTNLRHLGSHANIRSHGNILGMCLLCTNSHGEVEGAENSYFTIHSFSHFQQAFIHGTPHPWH